MTETQQITMGDVREFKEANMEDSEITLGESMGKLD